MFAGVHQGFSPWFQPAHCLNQHLLSSYAPRTRRVERAFIGFRTLQRMLGSDLAAAGGSGTGDLFNAGKAVVQGLEFYANWNVLGGLSSRMRMPVSVAYTFTDARFGSNFNSSFEPWGNVFEGDRIPYTPTHQLNGRIDLSSGRFTMGLGANYQSEVATVTGSLNDANTTKIAARMIRMQMFLSLQTHFECSAQ